MKCPRCERTPLVERERSGITVDACPECRGVWLDRGELEKLLSRETAEIEAIEHRYERARGGDARPGDRPQPARRHDDDDDYDDDRYGRGGKKRRGFLGTLGELFD